MPELKSYICPNCGANTTNSQNCEYCGSLLVRFVEKGIDFSHTSYTNNDAVFPGLIGELKRNLKLQNENPDELVSTDLFRQESNGDWNSINIMKGLIWNDGSQSPEFNGCENGLCIVVVFGTYTDVSSYKDYNEKINTQLARFRHLDSFPLFTPHNCTYTDGEGKSRYAREFAINFGQDVEGSARLVSEILVKVMGWSPSDPFDMFTNVGIEDIDQAREEWIEAHSFEDVSDEDSDDHSSNEDEKDEFDIPRYWYLIAVIAGILLIIIKHLFFS